MRLDPTISSAVNVLCYTIIQSKTIQQIEYHQAPLDHNLSRYIKTIAESMKSLSYVNPSIINPHKAHQESIANIHRLLSEQAMMTNIFTNAQIDDQTLLYYLLLCVISEQTFSLSRVIMVTCPNCYLTKQSSTQNPFLTIDSNWFNESSDLQQAINHFLENVPPDNLCELTCDNWSCLLPLGTLQALNTAIHFFRNLPPLLLIWVNKSHNTNGPFIKPPSNWTICLREGTNSHGSLAIDIQYNIIGIVLKHKESFYFAGKLDQNKIFVLKDEQVEYFDSLQVIDVKNIVMYVCERNYKVSVF